MWPIIITLAAVVVVAVIIFTLAFAATRKRRRPTHEKVDNEYIYRKEPHADQVAENPNTLDDNKVTKG